MVTIARPRTRTLRTSSLPTLDTEIEEGITVREEILIQTELAMIKAGILQPVSMKDAFKHLKKT